MLPTRPEWKGFPEARLMSIKGNTRLQCCGIVGYAELHYLGLGDLELSKEDAVC